MHPEWEVSSVNLAIAILNRQDPGDELLAIETLSGVLVENPMNVRAQYVSGIMQLYLGNAAKAIEHLQKAQTLDPTDAYSTYFLGQAHLQSANYEEAQTWLLKTIELNPAMRSAYWAAATASRRIDEPDRANLLIEQYQQFEHNPMSVTAGFSYKQMGPKAEAKSVVADVVQVMEKPEGPLFSDPVEIDFHGVKIDSLAHANMNDDDTWDLIASTDAGTVLLYGESNQAGQFSPSNNLAPHQGAVLIGDLNNDGINDVVVCTAETTFSIRFETKERKAQSAIFVPIADLPCDQGRLIDIDHDGDLDIVLVHSDGVTFLQNNLTDTYQQVETSPALSSSPAQQVVFVDLDVDRDVDLFVVGRDAPNSLWINQLASKFESIEIPQELANQTVTAATFGDLDVDGHPELIVGLQDGSLKTWTLTAQQWSDKTLLEPSDGVIEQLEAQDFDGDGRLDLLLVKSDGLEVLDAASVELIHQQDLPGLQQAASFYMNPAMGPSLITNSDRGVELWPAGPGRHSFLAITASGKTSADQMRSNASGIGTHLKLRSQSRWSINSTYPNHSGSSQSLMPIAFGSGGSPQAEYVDILWPDGVSQSESNLVFGELHSIEEIQRQLASCPVVFVWNGQKYEFVSDVLGVAALGFYAGPNQTAPVRSFERLLFDQNLLQARNGYFEIKIGEPMEEILYLDSASIQVYDLPVGYDMVLDERLHVNSAVPTGEAIFYRNEYLPKQAYSKDGEDIRQLILEADLKAANPGEVDSRYIGLMEDTHSITLEFESELPTLSSVLVVDGWMEFPYSQTVHASNQSEANYLPPSLEARDKLGNWIVVADQFGYPAGMPRSMALPIAQLPMGTTALRLSSNMEIYWDRIRVVERDYLVRVATQTITPSFAEVKTSRFALWSRGEQKLPYYDYDQRAPYWDTKHAEGNYSITGDVTPLVVHTDSALAIVGSGEEVHMRFKPLPQTGHEVNRRMVLDVRGWAKDMDLYTQDGSTVEPLPELPNLSDAELANRDTLHDQFNVRFQSGMSPQ